MTPHFVCSLSANKAMSQFKIGASRVYFRNLVSLNASVGASVRAEAGGDVGAPA